MATTMQHASSPPLDDHTSLTGSIGDFSDDASDKHQSPMFGLPSQHSGFRSADPSDDDALQDIASDDSPWSPPAWRQPTTAGDWYRHQPYSNDVERLKSQSASKSRGASRNTEDHSEDEEDQDATLAARIPLPRGSTSPFRDSSARGSVLRERSRSAKGVTPEIKEDSDEEGLQAEKGSDTPATTSNNFIRFALRAEVQQRTEPIEAAVLWLRKCYGLATKSWSSLTSTILIALFAMTFFRVLTKTPTLPPVPDLLKVAAVARSFEPLIHYAESGTSQIGELQDTGRAVWDLGESIRVSNMTSTPMIVSQLDELSESLKLLSVELTSFFADVEGDIDGILIVMDWAKRELSVLDALPDTSLACAFANVHTLLSSVGMLEDRSTGLQTTAGKLYTAVFGITSSQRTHQTLQRTFNEFLNVLEENINDELNYSARLFALFESIDRQFHNLQRTVVREFDTQERLESDLSGILSGLWSYVMRGNKAATLRKYEKNKNLLATIRSKTTHNKGILTEHNGRLRALKSNLENLRKKLVSPLVQTAANGLLGVDEQIKGLESTFEYLKDVRQKQRLSVQEARYGHSRKHQTIGDGEIIGMNA